MTPGPGECVEDIFTYHYKPELKCVLETVGLDGIPAADTTAGRVVNPGPRHRGQLVPGGAGQLRRATRRCAKKPPRPSSTCAIEAGWDQEYGGLLYFIDCMGCPPEAYEHDMKLWWPHNEILIASMMFYRDTGDERYLDWFNKTVDYCQGALCRSPSTASGTAISAGTACPPCLPARAAPSRAPSMCPAA